MSVPARWPSLTVDSWTDTRTTLHMWLQIVGKIQLVSSPLVNHWWNVAFEVSARGLRSRLLRQSHDAFDAEFDFIDHRLVLRTAAGGVRAVELKPRTVADFYAAVLAALAELHLDCVIIASPNEVSPAIPFAEDTTQSAYDAASVSTFWGQLLSAEHVFRGWRAGFAGKDSPVQVFWGSMDLSCVRYSGRLAPAWDGTPPPACPRWVMAEAESRENSAAGFSAGGGAEGAFYAYALPEPAGYASGTVSVGHYDASMGEWILPYEDVRTAADPDATLLTFLNETYALAANLGGWDRATLEVNPHRLDAEIFRPR